MGLCCWADRKTFRLRAAMVLLNMGSVFDVVHGQLGIVEGEYFDNSTINRTSFSSPRKQPPRYAAYVCLTRHAQAQKSPTHSILKSPLHILYALPLILHDGMN